MEKPQKARKKLKKHGKPSKSTEKPRKQGKPLKSTENPFIVAGDINSPYLARSFTSNCTFSVSVTWFRCFSFSFLVFILRTAIPLQSFQFQIRRTPFHIIRYYIQASADTLSSNQLRPMPPIFNKSSRNCVKLYASVRRESCNFCLVWILE